MAEERLIWQDDIDNGYEPDGIDDYPEYPDEGGEDAACRNPCGQEPMGCASCGERGLDFSSTPDDMEYGEFSDHHYWR